MKPRYLLLAMTLPVVAVALPVLKASQAAPRPVGAFADHADIGPVKIPGVATYDAETEEYTLQASGANMWAGQDEFHFHPARRPQVPCEPCFGGAGKGCMQ